MNNSDPKVYIIHENSEWVQPLRDALHQLETPFEEWFLNEGHLNLSEIPPEGVFYNRMSASSHTRDHRFAVEYTEPLLQWLELHNRRVVNNRHAMMLETRKTEQYLLLKKHGIKTPETILAVGKEQILQAAQKLNSWPLILKPNRGGKGQGVQLFNNPESLEQFVHETTEISLDGIVLIQEYLKPADGSIIRLEFIDGKFYYAVKVDATGGFELCPADACAIDDEFCPVGEQKPNKFQLLENFYIPEIPACERFLKESGIEVGAIEFIEDADGNRSMYDVNINTNYNGEAEQNFGGSKQGMMQIAKFLSAELLKLKYYQNDLQVLKKRA